MEEINDKLAYRLYVQIDKPLRYQLSYSLDTSLLYKLDCQFVNLTGSLFGKELDNLLDEQVGRQLYDIQ